MKHDQKKLVAAMGGGGQLKNGATIFMDIMALFMAFQTGNILAIEQAIEKLVNDVGRKLAPAPK